jgi:dipeptidyl aminopeptidase/acylaminoacyl peptidase
MHRVLPTCLFPAIVFSVLSVVSARGDDVKPAATEAPVSFLKDIAPILVQNCIACHNPKKSESKYVMTTFAQLAKGGQQGEGVTLEPGDPEASMLVELIKPGGEPRMPYKLDPLPADQIALVERWVKQGAKYDGASDSEDWIAVLRKNTPAVIPEAYPVPVPVTALQFRPGTEEIVTAGYHEINFWKPNDGTLARRLPGLAERVYEVAFTADGKWMATASGDPGQYGVVTLWKPSEDGSGGFVRDRDLAESNDCVFAVAFSPDNTRLAAAGADRAIRIWDVPSAKLLATIEDHADWIFDVAFSPDGKRLVSASRDKTCKVFDVEKKEALVTFPGHAQSVYSVSFSPDGKTIVSGGEDNLVRVWDPENDGKAIRAISGFGGPVFKVMYTPDGKELLACSADKTIRALDPAKGATLRTISGHNDWIYTLAISPDGKTVASGSWDGEVRLWKRADGKPERTFVAAPGFSR